MAFIVGTPFYIYEYSLKKISLEQKQTKYQQEKQKEGQGQIGSRRGQWGSHRHCENVAKKQQS